MIFFRMSPLSMKSEEKLPDRVKNLEDLIKKQMKMIQDQQTIIEKQKCLLVSKKHNSMNGNGDIGRIHCNGDAINRLVDESLEELIDRDETENDFDSDEDDLMK